MNLAQHYDDLYQYARNQLLTNQYQTDPLIASTSDTRRGLTLLIRPDDSIRLAIQHFLNELIAIEPTLYCYPGTDIHITVMSIISCYPNFELTSISLADYINVIQKCINGVGPIQIHFKGVTASDSAIMIQGFPTDNSLNNIRDNLRQSFKESALENSIDKRYTLFTAHSTVIRFPEQIKNAEALIQLTDKFRGYDFGKFSTDTLELVYNDWYQRERFVKQLYRFRLG